MATKRLTWKDQIANNGWAQVGGGTWVQSIEKDDPATISTLWATTPVGTPASIVYELNPHGVVNVQLMTGLNIDWSYFSSLLSEIWVSIGFELLRASTVGGAEEIYYTVSPFIIDTTGIWVRDEDLSALFTGLTITSDQASDMALRMTAYTPGNTFLGAVLQVDHLGGEQDAPVYGPEMVYTPIPPLRDYYEWTENMLNTFVKRLQAAIIADTTMATYNTKCPVVLNERLTRHKINAMLGKNLVVIFNPREGVDIEEGGNGREDVLLKCTVRVAVRSAKGFDDTDDQEIALIGDGTATQPGVLEMHEDLVALLHNNGNRLLLPDGGGEPYLWQIEWGESEPQRALSGEGEAKDEVIYVDTEVTGHRWRYAWS